MSTIPESPTMARPICISSVWTGHLTGWSILVSSSLWHLQKDVPLIANIDKEGPIYDFCWSPTSREFVVCYGCRFHARPASRANCPEDMPARTQLFDLKAKPAHSFGSGHRNVLLYQPQGRLLLSAGFGNLAGGVDVWDVSTRNKVAEFQ